MKRHTVLAVAAAQLVAAPLLIGGCTSQSPAQASPRTTSPSSSPTSSPATPTATATTASAADLRILQSNSAATAALFDLVAVSKQVQTDNTLPAARKTMTVALTTTRGYVKRARTAAYGTATRDCNAVRYAHSQTQVAAARTASASRAVASGAQVLSRDVASLDASTAKVRSASKALADSLRGATNPPTTVTQGQINAALSSAAAFRADTVAAIADAAAAAREAQGTAGHLVSQAAQIASNAC